MKVTVSNSSEKEKLDLAKSVYHKHFGRSTLTANEKIFFLEIDNTLAGLVRLCFEYDVFQLRSMLIFPEFRGKGFGRKFLKGFENYLDQNKIREIYCLPWAKLENFYSEIGFKKEPTHLAPVFLKERLNEYRSQNKDEIIFMRRSK